MRILIIGGAGHVASIVRPALEAAHEVRYFDLRAVPGAEDRTTVADVQDDAALLAATQGMDVVIWSALGVKAGTDKNSHDFDACVDVNIKGMLRSVLAAAKAGVRQYIHFSSMSVFQHFGSVKHLPIQPYQEPDGFWPYAITKRLAEHVGDLFAMNHPHATFLSLRLVHPCNEEQFKRMRFTPGDRTCAIGPGDMSRLVDAALRFTKPGAYHVNTTGDLEGKAYPTDATHALIGWKPEGN